MICRFCHIVLLLCLVSNVGWAQKSKLEFDGELSTHASWSPDNEQEFLLGGRYLPLLNYKMSVDSVRFFDIDASANVYASTMFHPFDDFDNDGGVKPYRLSLRYSAKQYELRLGLQKINFGSATLLRPLQWFDQIDPRDPLKFTNGVYGALGRYYFMNNANVWGWALYGNEDPRGFEFAPNHSKDIEYGGRVQYPVPKGEVALSYHHRTADVRTLLPGFREWKVPEDRFGFDAKWDVGVGLWVEATYSHMSRNLGAFTHQSLISAGTDYTFGLGNGVNLIAEHLISSHDQEAFVFASPMNISALMASYPLGFFDNLSLIAYSAWESEGYAAFLNYQHQFKYITTYLIAFYSSGMNQENVEGNSASSYSGPGIQIMLVYNH